MSIKSTINVNKMYRQRSFEMSLVSVEENPWGQFCEFQ